MQATTSPSAAVSYDFSEVYAEYFDHVWTYLRRLGVPTPLLDDAVQDVFVVCHRRLPEFEGRSTIRTWLFGIARRIAFRYHRREARAAQKHAALWREASPSRSNLDEDIGRAQAGEMLDEFLESLDDDKREVFVLAELESYSRTQLGEALGISPGTAYNRLRAARRRFEERFRHSPWQSHVRVCAQRPERVPEGARQHTWALLVPMLGLGETATTTGEVGTATTSLELGSQAANQGTTAGWSQAASGGDAALAGGTAASPTMGVATSTSTPTTMGWVVAAAAAMLVGGVAVTYLSTDAETEPLVVRASTVEQGSELASSPPVVREDASHAESELGSIPTRVPTFVAPVPAELEPPAPERLTAGPAAPASAKRSRPHGRSAAGSVASSLAVDEPRSRPARPAAPQLGDEVELLARAHKLASRPHGAARAIALLEDHERRFPSSAFEQERRSSRVVALCQLGRGADARAEADRLRQRFPSATIDDAAFSRCEP